VGGLALVSYLTAIVGVPVSARPVKNASQPFPCQGHTCGCMSTAQCLQQCCCCSPKQKPAGTEAQREIPAEPSCHDTACEHDPAHQEQGDEDSESSSPALGWVSGIEASKCRGLATLWISLNGALPPPPLVEWTFEWQTAGWLRLAVFTPCFVVTSPPDPPPRS